jgi:hypothetical protein
MTQFKKAVAEKKGGKSKKDKVEAVSSPCSRYVATKPRVTQGLHYNKAGMTP